jgi:hypothetical protein
MLDTDEIIGLRHTLRHAATHLDEVLEAITEDYHNGNKAPADVTSQLLPYLNSIENYATTLRHALTVMATGGLADNGEGNWWIGDGDGPYDTLAAALAAREDDEPAFVTQGLVNVEDDITARGGVFVMGADGDPEIDAQIRSIVTGDPDGADGEPDYGSPEERVLAGMRSAYGDGLEWVGLSSVAEYAGMHYSQAGTVLAGLVVKGQVERKGDRGAIYRLVEGG